MTIELSIAEIEMLLTSLEYSKDHIRNSSSEIRLKTLKHLEAVAARLSDLKRQIKAAC